MARSKLGVDELFGLGAARAAKCSVRAFTTGCVEKYGRVSVFREHSVYQVRGFNQSGQHVNRAFRTVTAARKAARKLSRSSGPRY